MAMRGHSYQVTFAPLVGVAEGTHISEPLTFMHTNHDDVIVVVERVRRTSGLDPDSAAATAVGLKLLSEVMLKEKANPLFDPLRGAMREFIQNLKSLATSDDQVEARSGTR